MLLTFTTRRILYLLYQEGSLGSIILQAKSTLGPIVLGRLVQVCRFRFKLTSRSFADLFLIGQDNTDAQCTIGYVPSLLEGDINDHPGPYDGVLMGCNK